MGVVGPRETLNLIKKNETHMRVMIYLFSSPRRAVAIRFNNNHNLDVGATLRACTWAPRQTPLLA
eukprot:scaffold23857_cov60-Phaeocystis_antarctica.AAC.4